MLFYILLQVNIIFLFIYLFIYLFESLTSNYYADSTFIVYCIQSISYNQRFLTTVKTTHFYYLAFFIGSQKYFILFLLCCNALYCLFATFNLLIDLNVFSYMEDAILIEFIIIVIVIITTASLLL